MRLPDEPETPFQINIVPMIDVVFAILTFFIMSTLFLTRQEGLPVNLPTAATGEQQTATPSSITVTVDSKQQISLNDKKVTLSTLNEEVSKLIGNNKEVLVVVNADARVSHGQVVAVMDKLRQIPGAKLAIATQKP